MGKRKKAADPGQGRKRRDTRIPESITERTVQGVKYTVYVYDELAYRENIARFYPDESPRQDEPARPAHNRPAFFPHRKRIARYHWTSWPAPGGADPGGHADELARTRGVK